MTPEKAAIREASLNTVLLQTPESVAHLFDHLVANQLNVNPVLSSYELFKNIADQLPKRISSEAKLKVLEAIASPDHNTRKIGEKAFLLLNMKTFITVVDAFCIEGVDKEEDMDEMLHAAIAEVLEKTSDRKTETPISLWVNNHAKRSIINFISDRNDIPLGLVEQIADRALILNRIKEQMEENGRLFFTRQEIEDLAEKFHKQTGKNKKKIFNWLELEYGNYPNRKPSEAHFEDPTSENAFNATLKDSFDHVLTTLSAREMRILKSRFGLENGIERTFEEVGREFGLTRERIRQIEVSAIRKLRHFTRSRHFIDYYKGEARSNDLGLAPNLDNVLYVKIYDRFEAAVNKQEKVLKAEQPANLHILSFTKNQIDLLNSSGIRNIEDFFSASPKEIVGEWNGDPYVLLDLISEKIIPFLDSLMVISHEDLNEEQKQLLTNIYNATLYKDGKTMRIDKFTRLLAGEIEAALREFEEFFSRKD